MTRYPVYERFASFQGEGAHMGRRAFFVRLYACDQKCPWCDSAGTWHKDYRPKGIPAMTAEQIAAEAHDAPADFAVITGGEPSLYDLSELIAALHDIGMPVHVETAGHHPLRGVPDWITLSPKLFDGALPVVGDVAKAADEIKFIIEKPYEIRRAVEWLAEYGVGEKTIWLHPEWGHRNDPDVLNAIIWAVKEYGFRAGYQLHKLYLADTMDKRARKEVVPLGGDPERGPSV